MNRKVTVYAMEEQGWGAQCSRCKKIASAGLNKDVAEKDLADLRLRGRKCS